MLSGNGYAQLTRLLTGAGYTWTVQDAEIVVVKLAGGGFDTAVLLTPESGLIGSPTPANWSVARSAWPDRWCSMTTW